MSTVSHRTQKDVARFIQQHSQSGKLQMSLVEIGENTGYSNATIYRTLKKLEESGIIKVVSSDVPTKPNTILYEGADTGLAHESIERITQTSHGILITIKNLLDECREATERVSDLENKLKSCPCEQNKIVSIQELPDGIHHLILARK